MKIWDDVKARHDLSDKKKYQDAKKQFGVDPTPKSDRTPAKKKRDVVGGVRG